MHVQEWLETVPAIAVYIVVAGVIGVESLGIPLPGEVVLVSAAVLASQHGHIDPYVLGACAVAGAVIGDSIGYAIGRKGGRPLIAKLEQKFPKHFSAQNVESAESSFHRWGMWAVFFGRFIALLRIFAGPLAGVLHMPYWKFLIANLLGGIVWAGGTTAVVYTLGKVAEEWLSRFSWLALLAAVLVGALSLLLMKRRAAKQRARGEAAEKILGGAGGAGAPAKARTETAAASVAEAPGAGEPGPAAGSATAAAQAPGPAAEPGTTQESPA
ncbi:DedA family protein [Streptomyces sp. SPB074]|uniref:DedA family protein n=1 Tax=Streptomyces sp. (strain SPB074) TaxID=465543 RepID=UPI0001D1DD21|nr:DedA family protein [Streptomyces sp. SPB074]EFG65630.1 DedA family protein [Streptomyces sp. SPB074]